MNFITWLFVGSFTGWLGGLIIRIHEQSNLQINIVVGIVGAFSAGVFVTPLFDIETINQRSFSLPSMMVSLGGAIALLTVVYLYKRFRTKTS
jgi:uncharacterized membrane protein YeaQ/YmgE (transglycosylase-associated protein family)